MAYWPTWRESINKKGQVCTSRLLPLRLNGLVCRRRIRLKLPIRRAWVWEIRILVRSNHRKIWSLRWHHKWRPQETWAVFQTSINSFRVQITRHACTWLTPGIWNKKTGNRFYIHNNRRRLFLSRLLKKAIVVYRLIILRYRQTNISITDRVFLEGCYDGNFKKISWKRTVIFFILYKQYQTGLNVRYKTAPLHLIIRNTATFYLSVHIVLLMFVKTNLLYSVLFVILSFKFVTHFF